MKKNLLRARRGSSSGFTLIELLVVVLIIGILAAIAVPQYFRVVEKGKASEAMSTLDTIRGAQERYLARSGNYCTTTMDNTNCVGWDMPLPTLKFFSIGPASAGAGSPSWQVTLTRIAPLPAVYAAYTINYDIEPNASPAISGSDTNVSNDLLPQ